ncbi:hypothetical protein L6164_001532 [Bauhinia variegata]|uniref:Uncharacterized protein n=1 Tax=Bauhinia variegata TaxID=167791 RepID=A0ACB9QB64_BAUVA|nr:hypothetical protein L6164_001532 [Bauhinia variegata]
MANKDDALADWSTGFFDCCSDGSSCCLTCWCPCVTFGRIAEIVDRGATGCCVHGTLYCLLGGFTHLGPSVYAWIYRTKMRKTYNIDGNECRDCLASCFCVNVSLCQQYRELKNRGYDLSAGWEGNAHLQGGGATAAPALEGGMTR